MTFTAGIVLACLAAVAINAGYVVQHAGLASLPPIQLRSARSSVRSMLGSRRWRLGAVLGYGGLVLDIAALRLAPLAVVQSIVAAGLLVVLGGVRQVTGAPATVRERVAVGLTVAAVITLPLGLPAHVDRATPTALGLAAFLAAAGAVATLLAGHGTARGRRRRPSLRLQGIAAGVLYGATNVALVALLAGGLHATAAGVVALGGGAIVTVAGFLLFQRGLQGGRPVVVVCMMTAATSVVAVAGGLLLFGDPLGGPPAIVLAHVAALATIPAAAVVVGVGVSEAPGGAGGR